jgi:hypothetical protein
LDHHLPAVVPSWWLMDGDPTSKVAAPFFTLYINKTGKVISIQKYEYLPVVAVFSVHNFFTAVICT